MKTRFTKQTVVHPRESDAVSSYVPTLKPCRQVPRYQQGLRSAFQPRVRQTDRLLKGGHSHARQCTTVSSFCFSRSYSTGQGSDSAVVRGLDVGAGKSNTCTTS